jgi:hypothetical protein
VKRAKFLMIVVACTIPSACRTDTLLGFAIGDISGLWVATTYVYTETANPQNSVDLIQRDGAMLTAAIDNTVNPPIVSVAFDDGMGTSVSGGGAVDIEVGTLMIGPDEFSIDHSGDRMTWTNSTMMYDFGGGDRPATLTIRLERI